MTLTKRFWSETRNEDDGIVLTMFRTNDAVAARKALCPEGEAHLWAASSLLVAHGLCKYTSLLAPRIVLKSGLPKAFHIYEMGSK